MFPRIESESKLNQPKLSRRRLLGMGAGIAAGLVLFGTVEQPRSAYAEVSSWPINSIYEYFNLKEGRLIANNGPLDIYDQIYGTRVRQFFTQHHHDALNKSKEALAIAAGEKPDVSSTWGFCSAAAVLNLEVGKLRALGLPAERAALVYQDMNKYGVMVAYHAGMTHFRPELYNTPANNSFFIKNLKDNRSAFIGRIKDDPKKIGDWYRVIHGETEDGTHLLTSGFGENNLLLPASWLEFSYQPESVEDSIANGRVKFIQDENKGFRTDELTKQRAYEFAGFFS